MTNFDPRLATLEDVQGENSLHKAARANCLNLVKHFHEKCGISVKCKNLDNLSPGDLTEDNEIQGYCKY